MCAIFGDGGGSDRRDEGGGVFGNDDHDSSDNNDNENSHIAMPSLDFVHEMVLNMNTCTRK